MELKVYHSQEDVFRGMTQQLMETMCSGEGDFHLALSGGGTAQQMFRLWEKEFRDRIDWARVCFYWVDERCVAPSDKESNFKYAHELLFVPLQISDCRIFRICGECLPEEEAMRYSTVVEQQLVKRGGVPRFDAVILGIGEDGHVASLFPEDKKLLTDKRYYAVAQHPLSGQKRITMTGTLILASENILIPAVGEFKTPILREVIGSVQAPILPAAYVAAHGCGVKIFTDCQIEM